MSGFKHLGGGWGSRFEDSDYPKQKNIFRYRGPEVTCEVSPPISNNFDISACNWHAVIGPNKNNIVNGWNTVYRHCSTVRNYIPAFCTLHLVNAVLFPLNLSWLSSFAACPPRVIPDHNFPVSHACEKTNGCGKGAKTCRHGLQWAIRLLLVLKYARVYQPVELDSG